MTDHKLDIQETLRQLRLTDAQATTNDATGAAGGGGTDSPTATVAFATPPDDPATRLMTYADVAKGGGRAQKRARGNWRRPTLVSIGSIKKRNRDPAYQFMGGGGGGRGPSNTMRVRKIEIGLRELRADVRGHAVTWIVPHRCGERDAFCREPVVPVGHVFSARAPVEDLLDLVTEARLAKGSQRHCAALVGVGLEPHECSEGCVEEAQ